MTKNPIINAVVAEAYIVMIVSVMSWGAKLTVGKDNDFLAPLAMISLFTLSTAVMGYIFGLKPLELFLDGKKKLAAELFLKTVGVFSILTMISLVLMFGRVLG